jgi:hypothetical protein
MVEVSETKFLVADVIWKGHLEAVEEVSIATFFISYLGWTVHVESLC